MANEEQSPIDYFPLDELSVQMQLGMYEYVDGWTANELRKVDRLRRRLVDGNPRLFQKKRLIPEVTVMRRNPNDSLTLDFYDYCKYCKNGRRNNISLYFDNEGASCTKGNWMCYTCERAGDSLTSTSPVIGLSLDECSHLATKGSKIRQLTLKGNFSNAFVQGVRHLIDSSLSLHIAIRQFESTELFTNLVQEPKKLDVLFYEAKNESFRIKMFEKKPELISDEFCRNAGRYSLVIHGNREELNYVPLTDKQLGILAGRRDLTAIDLDYVGGITSEGIKRAIQILLHSSPKRIRMKYVHIDHMGRESLKEMFERDVESDRYSYEDGKMEVVLHFSRNGFCSIKMHSH